MSENDCSNACDVLVWPCGFWLYRSEYEWEEYRYMGDDYMVLPYHSEERKRFFSNGDNRK